MAKAVTDRLGFEVDRIDEPVPLEEVDFPSPASSPEALAEMFSDEPYDRVRTHSQGLPRRRAGIPR